MLDFMTLASQNGEMTEKELSSNVFLFFLAGHETTATALAFLIQVLALNPEIQDKMRKEVIQELKDEKPDYENTKKLDLMAAAIKENLRMYGPVTQLQRTVDKDTILEDVFLPKGTNIGIDFEGVNMSKEIYGDPDTFRPERWLNNECNQTNWIPFGAGSRVCVGNHFSLLEQKIFMSLLLKKFKWEFVEKNVKIEFERGFLRSPLSKNVKFINIQ